MAWPGVKKLAESSILSADKGLEVRGYFQNGSLRSYSSPRQNSRGEQPLDWIRLVNKIIIQFQLNSFNVIEMGFFIQRSLQQCYFKAR